MDEDLLQTEKNRVLRRRTNPSVDSETEPPYVEMTLFHFTRFSSDYVIFYREEGGT